MKLATACLLAIVGAVNAAAPMVGTDKCTYGPSYWCASTENAEQCDFSAADCKKYCDNPKEYPDIQSGNICSPPPGSNNCTQGPSYWCASEENAKECDFPASNCTKYCENEKEYPDIQDGDICSPAPGSNPCTQGPSYWCASKANAKECDVPIKNCAKYCKNDQDYPGIQNGNICKRPPGSKKCTQGPSYWCASLANAKACGMQASACLKYCQNPEEYPELKESNVCESLD